VVDVRGCKGVSLHPGCKESPPPIVEAKTTEQCVCSKFKSSSPHCYKKDPRIVDLLRGTPYNMQIANCCKAKVVNTFNQEPTKLLPPSRSVLVLLEVAKHC
jgi:hypothetical protein